MDIIIQLKKTKFTLLIFVLLLSCRPAQYLKESHLEKSIIQLSDKKTLVAELVSNISNTNKEEYTQTLYNYLKSCSQASILNMDDFYNQYQFGYASAKGIDEQLELLNKFTDIDYLIVPYARIENKGSLILHRDLAGQNAAVGGIEIFHIKEQRMLKFIEYFGKTRENSIMGDQGSELEIATSSQKIVKKCYKKSMGAFLRYTYCGKSSILP